MPNRMDQMVSKGMATMKAAKATVEGLVGVFKVLAKQHGEAGALVKMLKAEPSKYADLWPKIKMELTSHEQAEMREVYPVMRQFAELREIADHHDSEAGELSTLIQRLDALTPQTAEWKTLYDKLHETLMHHVAEEENEIFPKAQKVIGEDRAREIEPKFLATKQQAMNIH